MLSLSSTSLTHFMERVLYLIFFVYFSVYDFDDISSSGVISVGSGGAFSREGLHLDSASILVLGVVIGYNSKCGNFGADIGFRERGYKPRK